jgi:hypothetical protein
VMTPRTSVHSNTLVYEIVGCVNLDTHVKVFCKSVGRDVNTGITYEVFSFPNSI